jgi:hypothetical protein
VFRLLPNGFRNPDLRTLLADLLGYHPPELSAACCGCEDGVGETPPQQRGRVREHPDDVGAALDLLMWNGIVKVTVVVVWARLAGSWRVLAG